MKTETAFGSGPHAGGGMTLLDIFRHRAAEDPNHQAYAFIVDGKDDADTLTFGELDRRARAVAAALQAVKASNERVLLLYPAGLDFISGFLGCLYARAIAVPVPPPRFNRKMERLTTVAVDCGARIVLTTRTTRARIGAAESDMAGLSSLTWLSTDEIDLETSAEWVPPSIDQQTLAFLQYTSGSTTTPRGVMVTHGNLLHNERLIQNAFKQSEKSVVLSWLPFYHDMGLIGGLLQPLYLGATCVLMSPVSVMKDPLSWLRAISTHKATTSGGPNFAYDLCVRQTRRQECSDLDLSSWTVAFNGAEPIRSETLDQFTQVFEPFGFSREAFFPCYGLAEATLMISGGGTQSIPLVKTVQAEALKENRVVEPSDGADHSLVASGKIGAGHEVAIVDPQSLTLCSADQIGEIWISGPSVASGYYNREEETRQTFQAYPAGTDKGPMLRSGDLGFIRDGELFVTGRLKDLIIVRGQNYYPHDIESTVQRVSLVLRQGGGAVFAVEIQGEERLVIVQEMVTPRSPQLDEVINLIRLAVSEQHELPPYSIVLIKPGSIPRTSSGKIRRQTCREQFLAAQLQVLAQWQEPSFATIATDWSNPARDRQGIEHWLIAYLSSRLGLKPNQIDIDQPISRYGLDSLAAVDLLHSLESGLGLSLPLAVFFQTPNIGELAQLLCELQDHSPALSALPDQALEHLDEYNLSRGQQALYFLHQLTHDQALYNIAATAAITGPIDIAGLQDAFQKLVDRHSSLRTNFFLTPDGPRQRINEQVEIRFREVDAGEWTDQDLNDRIRQDAARRIDLEHESPLILTWYQMRDRAVLLIVIHHIVVDFWSLGLLVRDLDTFGPLARTNAVEPPPSETAFHEFVKYQEDMLAGPEGDRLLAYWRQKLAGDLPSLELPTDRAHAPLQSYESGAHYFRWETATAEMLARLSRERGVTQFTLVTSAFHALLYRYTGQHDLLTGALTNGRNLAKFAGTVGYFVNSIVLRVGISDGLTFSSLVERMQETVLEALAHQDYPFPLLIEKLQIAHDPSRPPLIQAMMMYQQARLPNQEALSHFAIGETGAKAVIAGIDLEFTPLPQTATEFELTLKIAATEQGLSGCLQYNASLFDLETISRMVNHLRLLTTSLLDNPENPISSAALMTATEINQLLVEWNNTGVDYPADELVHRLFASQVHQTPDAIAVSFHQYLLTYRGLEARANQLANVLRKHGVGCESRVGICLNRSIEMMIGLLGILTAGAAYVPLDPAFPRERLSWISSDAALDAIVTQRRMTGLLPRQGTPVVFLDDDLDAISSESDAQPEFDISPDNLAYVIYTSGSTGRPKGVMISHRNVVNFFHAMDQELGWGTPGRWLAVTSISFDISVLELLRTVSCGFEVVIQSSALTNRPPRPARQIDFSLFYFSADDQKQDTDKYRLLLEGARFADQHGFSAVWTPERHFHAFGGLYPNPSVTGAAIAAITKKIEIRAGSVVLPLHNPIRVAEEWSVVDNISQGRVGISVASGWHADDFILSPENYAERKELMRHGIDVLRRLWRGEAVAFKGAIGRDVEARTFPRPVQHELPLWITAAGSVETFRLAGEMGTGLLTHLLGQNLDELAEKIAVYRQAWQDRTQKPGGGHVTLMVHTFIGDDLDAVRAKVRDPFRSYLKSSYGLIKNLALSLGQDIESEHFSAADMDQLLDHAFDRYFHTSGLMGTLDTCRETVERLQEIGVDEIACLIDFGLESDTVLEGLRYLEKLKEQVAQDPVSDEESPSILEHIQRRAITHLQCTPTLANSFAYEPASFGALQGLESLLLGGEALPLPLAQELSQAVVLRNLYGPTETTIWSTTDRVDASDKRITIGRPIGNTQTYVLDHGLEPVPLQALGGLYIGGSGVVRGYVNSPDLTAEKFIPDPFTVNPGKRFYATGDVARHVLDGRIEFLGRVDQQVKLRGHRIELGEIETALASHPSVLQTAVVVRPDSRGDDRLTAYVVCESGRSLTISEMREFLQHSLAEYMIPSILVNLAAMPLTANGKLHRQGLPLAQSEETKPERFHTPPRTPLEEVLAAIWAEVLNVEEVGIHDNFFALGGHSILTAQLVARLRATLRIELPLRTFYEAPTIARLAEVLTDDPEQAAKVNRIAELVISVAQCSEEEAKMMLGNPASTHQLEVEP